jgi:hypothetical protein
MMATTKKPESAAPATKPAPTPAPPAPAVPKQEAAPKTPDGYAARTITLPTRYWESLDSLAERAGVDVSKWLERYLTQFGR